MKEILEGLNLSPETKEIMTESFDAAVDTKVEALVEAKETEYKEYLDTQVTEMKAKLEDTLDSYLDKVVETFVEDNTFAMDEAIKGAQYDAVLEGFNSLLVTTGVDIKQIAEAKVEKDSEDETSLQTDLDETTELADSLMEEVIELKERNSQLLKTGLIKESMENMTVLEKDKFLTLTEVAEFDAKDPMTFIAKLDVLAESVKNTKEVVVEKVVEKVEETVITENYLTNSKHLF